MMTDVRAPRPAADRIARQLLRVERVDPRALVPLQGSLIISGVRCLVTYLLVPAVTPVVGLAGVLATPVSIALSSVAAVLSLTSLRRVWIADHRLRWPYTAFIAVVVLLLLAAIVVDVFALTG